VELSGCTNFILCNTRISQKPYLASITDEACACDKLSLLPPRDMVKLFTALEETSFFIVTVLVVNTWKVQHDKGDD